VVAIANAAENGQLLEKQRGRNPMSEQHR
jgi:hypothetical protein